MELFNDLVIPVGSDHLALIGILKLIAAAFLYSYTGILFGSVLLSVIAGKKSKQFDDPKFLKLAQDYIHVGTGVPSMWFGLGIVPYLSVILTYPQLLHGTNSDVIGYLLIGFFLYIAAIAAIYIYKKSVNFKSIFFSFKKNVSSKKVEKVKDHQDIDLENDSIGQFSAFWGLILLVLAAWFLTGSTVYAYDHSLWGGSIFSVIFAPNTIFKLLLVLTLGVAFASAIFMFLNFSWDGGKDFEDKEFENIAKNNSRKAGLYSSLLLPLLYAFEVATVPAGALSYSFFIFALISLLFAVFYAQSVYLTKNPKHIRGIKYGFIFVMISFMSFTASDHEAFKTSINDNIETLLAKHQKIEEERLAMYESGDKGPQIDAKEIFDTRCVACHKMDEKFVGPAYNKVVPKYKGKMDELTKYILNPVSVNPDEFPAGMPNQGLTPAEAKAMAKYLMDQVLGGEEEQEAAPKEEEKQEEATASN